MAFFMAKVASPRWRRLLVALVITPLWASYLVKVYAWQAMVQPETGVLAWLLKPFGLDGPGYGAVAVILTLSYLWLPYMILPIYAGLERLPDSLLEASGDLGRRPLADLPLGGAAAGLPVDRGRVDLHVLAQPRRLHHRADRRRQAADAGQHRLPELRGRTCRSRRRSPLIPVVIMLVYLAAVRRTGALENL